MLGALNLLTGFLLDFFLGDPGGRWHVVVGIGKLIEGLEKALFPGTPLPARICSGFCGSGGDGRGLGVSYFFSVVFSVLILCFSFRWWRFTSSLIFIFAHLIASGRGSEEGSG